MKNAVLGEMTPCGFLRTYVSEERMLVTVNVFSSSLIIFTLMMEMLHSLEMSVITRATRRNIQEYGILYSHRREKP
jgi:hypothetical protein